ncbi:hypothetical protein JCM3765_000080 [Sporobolomyces pararoseus]
MDLSDLSRDLPKPSSSISDFPPELLTKIFKSIPYWPSDNRRKTLASLCLVNHYFLLLARPLLYNSLKIHIDWDDPRCLRFMLGTLFGQRHCSRHVKSLRVTFEKEGQNEIGALKMILHAVKLDTLKIKASQPIQFFQTILWSQPNLKKLVLPDYLMDERLISQCFPLLPELEIFKGRIWVDENREFEEEEAEHQEEVNDDRPAPFSTPPTFKLRELYLAWGPRQDAFDYTVQFSFNTLTHLTLTMNDWRAVLDLSKLVALESLVFVANSNNVSLFGGEAPCLLALRECMKTVKTLPSLRSLAFEGTLQWTKKSPFAAEILSSLPESLEELSLGKFNSSSFNFELFRRQLSSLPLLRKVSLLRTKKHPSDSLLEDLLTRYRVQVIINPKSDKRVNHYLGDEIDPTGASSEVDSEGEDGADNGSDSRGEEVFNL